MLTRVFSVVFCLVFCTIGFTHQTEMYDACINEIIANHCDCISDVVNDRIYIHADKVAVTPQGLFLNVNDKCVGIPALYSDAQGIYIQKVLNRKVTSPCPFCGWERISGAIKCRNPNCPSNQPKDK